MSFVDQEDVLTLTERLYTEIVQSLFPEKKIAKSPFPRLTYKEAMEKYGKPPGHSTIHQEIVCLRQILKTANRHGWLQHLPDLTQPYKSSTKISHRAWFSPEE